MKYLITFLLAFVTILGYSQPVQLRSGGSVTPLDSNLIVGKALRVPVFEDTANANTYRTLDSAGKVIFTRADNNVWIRTTEKAWSLIGVGGSYIDSIWVSDDRTAYIYGKAAVEVGRMSTLMTTLATEIGSGLTLRTNTQLDSVFIGGGGTMRTTSYLVSTGGVVLVDSTLTVTAPIYWVYRGVDSSELSDQIFTINAAAAGDVRTDVIWIDSLGVFTKTVGTPDTAVATSPSIDYNGIVVAYADVDGSTVTVNAVSSFQGNAVVFTQGTGVNNGQTITDSLNLGFNQTTRTFRVGSSGVEISQNGGTPYIKYIGTSGMTVTDHLNRVLLRSNPTTGGVGIGATPVVSAQLELSGTTRGFLPNRLTGVQQAAISSPATGLIIYNTDSLSLCLYNGSAWVKLGSGGSGSIGTLQQAFDAAPTASPQINASTESFKVSGASTILQLDNTPGSPNVLISATQGFPNDVSNRIDMGVTIDLQQAANDGGYVGRFRVTEFESYFENIGSNGLTHQVGINKQPDCPLDVEGDGTYVALFNNGNLGIGTNAPDSALTVVNGIKQTNNYYTAAASNTMLVIDTLTGGYGHQAIPGGGSTDTTSLSNRINLKADIASPTLVTPILGVASATSLGIGATATSKIHIQTNAIGVTQSDANGLLLENTTAATLGNQQYSPPIVLRGRGWSTTSSASQNSDIRIMNTPIQGTTSVLSRLVVERNNNSTGYSELFSIGQVSGSSSNTLSINSLPTLGVGGGVTQLYGGSSGYQLYNSSGSVAWIGINNLGKMTLLNTVTTAGTTGDRTINQPSGTVNMAAGGTTLTVTNSTVTTSSLVFATVRTNDATAIIKNVVPGSGSFVITLSAAATAETSIGFFVIN